MERTEIQNQLSLNIDDLFVPKPKRAIPFDGMELGANAIWLKLKGISTGKAETSEGEPIRILPMDEHRIKRGEFKLCLVFNNPMPGNPRYVLPGLFREIKD